MKLNNLLYPLAFLTFAISSCASFKHSARLSQIPNAGLKVTNKVAVDVEVNLEKIIKARSNKHKSINDAKEEAYYKAIVDNNIHIVVDPIYSVRTDGKFLYFFGGKSTAEIVGYAGMYSNPRSLKEITDSEAATKILSEQKKLKQDVENYNALSKYDITSTKIEERLMTDGKTAPLSLVKEINRSTPYNNYFKFLSIIK